MVDKTCKKRITKQINQTRLVGCSSLLGYYCQLALAGYLSSYIASENCIRVMDEHRISKSAFQLLLSLAIWSGVLVFLLGIAATNKFLLGSTNQFIISLLELVFLLGMYLGFVGFFVALKELLLKASWVHLFLVLSCFCLSFITLKEFFKTLFV